MKRILHISDNLDELLVERSKLRDSLGDLEIETAMSLDDAMRRLDGQQYDCVVVEGVEGGTNGLELLNALRAQKNHTPVVLSCENHIDYEVWKAFSADSEARVEIGKEINGRALGMLLNKTDSMRSDVFSEAVTIETPVENASQIKALADNVPVGLMIVNAEGKIEYINKAFSAYLNYDYTEELQNRHILKLFTPGESYTAMTDIRSILLDESSKGIDRSWKLLDKNGNTVVARIQGVSITVRDRRSTAIVLSHGLGVNTQTQYGPEYQPGLESGEQGPNVLVICDGFVMRSGLKVILEGTGANYEFLEVSEGIAEEISAFMPDAVVYATSTFDAANLVMLERFIEAGREIPVILTTLTSEQQNIARAIKAGVSGIVRSETEFDRLPEAVNMVTKGAYWFSRGILSRGYSTAGAEEVQSEPVSSEAKMLTPREREVLVLLSQGYRNKTIADTLGLSYRTVVTHVYNIYRKLKINSRTEAIRFAMQHGLVELP